jgi:hypothetical protein
MCSAAAGVSSGRKVEVAVALHVDASKLVDEKSDRLREVLANVDSQPPRGALEHFGCVGVVGVAPLNQVIGGVGVVGGHRARLGVDCEGVVTLVEDIERRLPVRVQEDALVEDRLGLPEGKGREDFVEGREVRGERFRGAVHVDPDEAAPGVEGALHEAESLLVDVLRAEFPAIHHEAVPAVELPTPAVARTSDRPPFEVSTALDQASTAVSAAVEEGLEPVGCAAHDEDRLVSDFVFDVVAHVGDLVLPAGDLPDPGPQLLGLEARELGREVATLRDEGRRQIPLTLPLARARHPTRLLVLRRCSRSLCSSQLSLCGTLRVSELVLDDVPADPMVLRLSSRTQVFWHTEPARIRQVASGHLGGSRDPSRVLFG